MDVLVMENTMLSRPNGAKAEQAAA
jgi:hypothetical protein